MFNIQSSNGEPEDDKGAKVKTEDFRSFVYRVLGSMICKLRKSKPGTR